MRFPRIMISAISSGSGKTLITCAILKALKNRNKNAAAFKCGPDYIDPMFHKKILKMPSRNLDTYFTKPDTTRYLFTRASKGYDISVIEGVMGYYDGVGGISEWGSAYELSKTLLAPVILVINAKGMSLSVAAVIKGVMEFRTDSNISGVILNQVSGMFYPELKKVIEEELHIRVLGYLPNVRDCVIESRHLGLVLPDEIVEIEEKIEKLAQYMEETIDIDAIVHIADHAPELKEELRKPVRLRNKPVIALAYDEAFCFYYEDNLELMKEMGAEIILFSPLHDENLPDHIDGLILGGGYPELYASQLSKNQTMLLQIKNFVKDNCPVIAECGGFMYLHETMEDNEAKAYPMVGAIEGKAYKTNKLGRFGYIELTPNQTDSLLAKHQSVKGHEFHYFDSTNCGQAYHAKKPMRKREWDCIHGSQMQYMGFPHLYYYSNPEFIYNFLSKCK
ncbi:cobyrinate a,c-diamide synthase [Lachnotalea glycerini]|uniref:Cobyrinate a,c-diamide synthase n=1 Tax=Lachnotalea glycerini TaxID=1763509 RepID=A0A371JK68_9FIRM|nr:cobyrinate a,c-diamide synthase [Lachnotalea glycerini]RDY33126.1 cobyrinate a,c-diamide synthase [Lachnotalea glycerini]